MPNRAGEDNAEETDGTRYGGPPRRSNKGAASRYGKNSCMDAEFLTGLVWPGQLREEQQHLFVDRQVLSHGDEAAMTPKVKKKQSAFTREEAKLILDNVLRRYGIHRPSPLEGTHGKVMVLAAPKVQGEKLVSEPMPSGPIVVERAFAPVRESDIGPPLELGWRPYPLEKDASLLSSEPTRGWAEDEVVAAKAEGEPAPAERQTFHYLIRILECASTLHCQVTAVSAADAKDQIMRIPNLLEWRGISAKELAEIIKTEVEDGTCDGRRR